MKVSTRILTRLAAVSLLFFANDTAAFFPTNLLSGAGLLGHSHTQITRDALSKLYLELFQVPLGDTPKSMAQARDAIAAANADVDKDQEHGAKHFDGESFPEGQDRLIELKAKCIFQMVRNNDVNGAQTSLGQALHTLQDFYSHSNYFEMKEAHAPFLPLPHLGMEGYTIARLAESVNTCTDCDDDSGILGFLKKLVTCPNCAKNVEQSKLTSGYYSGEDRVKTNTQKCSHGGPFDGSSGEDITSRGQGINKDSSSCKFSPHYHLHVQVATMAEQASIMFIKDALTRFNDEHVRAFFGADGSATVVRSPESNSQFNESLVDEIPTTTPTTTSQKPRKTINVAKRGASSYEKPHWSFDSVANVPKGGRVFLDATADQSHVSEHHAAHVAHMAAHHQVKVSAVVAAGSAGAAAYSAMTHHSGGHLFKVYGDEEQHIEHFSNSVAAPHTVDIAFIHDAFTDAKRSFEFEIPVDSTVGNVSFIASGVDKLTVMAPNDKTYSSAAGSSTEGPVKIVDLKTNKMIQIGLTTPGNHKVIISASSACLASEFTLTVTGTSYLDLTHFHFVELNGRPGHMGYYRIEGAPVASPGDLTVASALMSGSYTTASFSFRTPSGEILYDNVPLRPGSGLEGEQPSDEFLAPYAQDDVSFSFPMDLMDEIMAYDPSFLNMTSPGSTFSSMPLPEIQQPFVVHVTGRDVSGSTYQRVVPRTYTPASILIQAQNLPEDLRHDRETVYNFRITNAGDSDIVDLTAADNHGLFSRVSPSTIQLAKGASKLVQVTIRPHEGDASGTNNLIVTATKRKGGCKNYVVISSHTRPENPEYEDTDGSRRAKRVEVDVMNAHAEFEKTANNSAPTATPVPYQSSSARVSSFTSKATISAVVILFLMFAFM